MRLSAMKAAHVPVASCRVQVIPVSRSFSRDVGYPSVVRELGLGALSRWQRRALAPFGTPLLIGHKHRCGHSNGVIGADEDADHQGKEEATQNLAAKDVKRQNGEKRQARG